VREPPPDYSANQYERPNQPWVCGLTAAGQACAAGPTARGRCPALAECAPTRDGDRWQCHRSALRGGPCDEGPTPEGGCGRVLKCHPVRSLRMKRGRFVAACGMLVVGGAMIALSANWRDRVIRPGPLARQHAQLLERADGGAPNCGACHAAAAQNVAGWAASLVIAQNDQPSQSQLCMNCHDKSISKDLALAAHNVPPEALRQITTSRPLFLPLPLGEGRGEGEFPTLRTPSPLPKGEGPSAQQSSDRFFTAIACATCHREHHGATADLTSMDNVTCQTCHRQRYDSFAGDHPYFGLWPYQRRTRIAFNHASHRGKHFVEKKQAFDCRACHVSDASGAVEQTVNYETACAACHDEKIATSVGRGVAMFAVPTLDIAAMKKAGHDVGPWPAEATGDFDGRLPPAMKLLLAADPKAAQAIAALGVDFDFQDVDLGDAKQLAAAAELAAAIKSLFGDVSARGPAAVRDRLSATLGRDVTEVEVATLTAGLSVDTIRGAAGWLSGVDAGGAEWQAGGLGGVLSTRSGLSMLQHRAGMPPPAVGEGMAPDRDRFYSPAGTWSRDNATLLIRYRPTAHADPVLAAWIEVLAKTPRLDSRPLAAAMLQVLTKTTAPGLCASCHSVEHSDAGALVINWQAYDRTTAPRGLTKFAHKPHLVLPQLADCVSCHAIDDAAGSAPAYIGLNPRQFVSDFKQLTKRQCAECHTPTAAGDRCQSCHNYHVESVEAWRLQ
jgi:hypothetical protein